MSTTFNATIRSITAISFAILAVGCSSSQVQPRLAAELPGYCEGIVFDSSGTAYVSTLHREAVFAIKRAGSPEKWHHVIEPNGHKILPDGTHLIASKGGVRHVAPDGTLIEVLAPELATPNDLAIDGDGGVYVTVPAQSEQDRNAMRSGVYYIDPSHVVLKIADDFCYPNGVAVRADGRTLLVNDSCNRRLYEFRIDAPGVLSHRRLLAELPDAK